MDGMLGGSPSQAQQLGDYTPSTPDGRVFIEACDESSDMSSYRTTYLRHGNICSPGTGNVCVPTTTLMLDLLDAKNLDHPPFPMSPIREYTLMQASFRHRKDREVGRAVGARREGEMIPRTKNPPRA